MESTVLESGFDEPVNGNPKKMPPRPIGRFIIGHATFAHDWRALLPLFAQVVVVRAESLYHLDGIEYVALSGQFDPIKHGEVPPLYDVQYRSSEAGEEVTFTRQ